MVYNLRADYLKWDTAKKGWKLENALERKIDGVHESIKQYPSMDVKLNVLPRGTEGLNDYRVERYRRDATPFSVFILTIIGAVVASRKTRGGSGLHMAMGIVTAAIFVVMDKFSLTFSTKGNFPPLIAAWMPNIIFTAIAAWLYRIAPK